jgi:carbonic anhydrase
LLKQVNETSAGQFPFATILSCIDSRTSAELIFDQGLGDIFSIRLAGNVVNEDVLGSMEFSCRLAGSRLVVVLGHTGCGAIKGACDEVQLGHLTTLLNKIQPAVYLEKTITTDRTSGNEQFVRRVTDLQVRRSVDAIVERSVVLRSLVESGQIGLVGGRYSVEDGSVEFFDDTYMCGEVKHFFLQTTA